MRRTRGFLAWSGAALVLAAAMALSRGMAAETNAVADAATLKVRAGEVSPHAIPAGLTGKFAEHLGHNIAQGMEAQILHNPTFADYPFWTGQTSPDGLATYHFDRAQIAQEIRRQAPRFGWPASAVESAVEARNDGLACWWIRLGSRDAVQVSPDTGPQGGRAQRIDAKVPGAGLGQWTYLPAHRSRSYECELFVRSPDLTSLDVSLDGGVGPAALAATTVTGISSQWRWFRVRLALPAESRAAESYRFAISTGRPGQLVLAHVRLLPADHVGGADPDVIRLLRAARVPVLRWPGGNFVSGYRWEDGIGPLEARPTRPNPAWGSVEPNTFGTREFVAFCRAVGCDPWICVNAGDGTAAEAARWVEYCNGPTNSPMGARRAAEGHPTPFNIRHWEVGNELWGRWQVRWTTAAGYVDRYRQFAQAMLAADPTIHLYACGAPVFWGDNWNRTLIAGAANQLTTLTDHPLIGGDVSPNLDPMDVFRDFMGVPQVLEDRWTRLRSMMSLGGIPAPRLAVTELQLFAHLRGAAANDAPATLTPATLVSPSTLAEGLYDVLIYHAAARLAPFVEAVTHSATVNHGGGLRKERERVFANPCHHAQAMFAELAGARPVAMELAAPRQTAPMVLPDLKAATNECVYSVLDALAALNSEGALLLSLVHRGGGRPIRLEILLDRFAAFGPAQVRTLAATAPWAVNSLEQPDEVHPVDSTAQLDGARLTLALKPFSYTRVRLEPQPARSRPPGWTAAAARQWAERTGPIRGFNYVPRTAVNATEMWQASTFDAHTIDQELGWARAAGYNAARVFLPYVVWADAPAGFKQRFGALLTLADLQGLRVMPVLFDDCAFDVGRDPYLGPQDEPTAGVHNSRWVACPGVRLVADRTAWSGLERYVTDLVTSFGQDARVLAWDLYNEPGNSGMGDRSLPLVEATFAWARACQPTQPLTCGPWTDFESPMSRRLMEWSDIISFHAYDAPEGVRAKIERCQASGRPVVCTEWLHRPNGNTFADVLPLFARHRVGWFHWGFVAGRTQTFMPWGSKPGDPAPARWQHDVLRADGKPFDPAELRMVRNFRYAVRPDSSRPPRKEAPAAPPDSPRRP